jgi:hypothetical protein
LPGLSFLSRYGGYGSDYREGDYCTEKPKSKSSAFVITQPFLSFALGILVDDL